MYQCINGMKNAFLVFYNSYGMFLESHVKVLSCFCGTECLTEQDFDNRITQGERIEIKPARFCVFG